MNQAKNHNSIYEPTFERGLPEHYPIPRGLKQLVFYIQRNQNTNTVLYEANLDYNGNLIESKPIKISWLKYMDRGQREELNFLQSKLAYGLSFKKINNQVYEFSFHSYPKKRFFLNYQNKKAVVTTNINNRLSILTNIFVFSEDFGVFPDVKYIELYGLDQKPRLGNYEKFFIEYPIK